MRLATVVYPLQLTVRDGWQDHANCLGLPIDVFFPANAHESAVNLRLIKPICAACPVRPQCLEYSLSFQDKQLQGIWAGVTENERRRLRYQQLLTQGMKPMDPTQSQQHVHENDKTIDDLRRQVIVFKAGRDRWRRIADELADHLHKRQLDECLVDYETAREHEGRNV